MRTTETQLEAWAFYEKHVKGKLMKQILRQMGDRKVTCFDLEAELGRSHQTVSGTLTRLQDCGAVVHTGGFSFNPDTEMKCRVYQVNPVKKKPKRRPRKSELLYEALYWATKGLVTIYNTRGHDAYSVSDQSLSRIENILGEKFR